MERRKPPIKVLIPGRVFRSEGDATHSPMFHQMEGLVIDKNLSVRDLYGVLDYLAKKLESQLKNKLEVLETKKRHLEGRLMVCPSGKKEAVKKQIAAVEKQIELYKNTADQEKYKALIEKKVKELTSSSSSSKARKDKKDKKSKKSKKSKKK